MGWARQEFAALGIPFEQRGRLTDDHLRDIRAAWADTADYGPRGIPVWVGGNSDAGLRRAVRLGDAWHPLRCTVPWLREAADRLRAVADERQLPVPALAPRITLDITSAPVSGPQRLAGQGALDQIMDDLDQLRLLGAETVVLDHYHGDPDETRHPRAAWQALAAVAAHLHPPRTGTEQS